MNLLFLTLRECNPTTGGIERITWTLAKDWLAKGYEVSILSVGQNKGKGNHSNELDHYFLPEQESISSENNRKYFYTLLKRLNIDIVINQVSNVIDVTDLCLEVKKHLKDVRWISVMHYEYQALYKATKNNFFIPYINNTLKKKFLAFLKWCHFQLINSKKLRLAEDQNVTKIFELSDKVVLLSNKALESYRKFDNNSKIDVIPNPIDTTVDYESFNKKKQVLYVGRLEMGQKRVDRLLRIWGAIETKFPEWDLVIVGDGDYKYLYEQIAKDINLKNILFTGFTDPEKYYAESAILCLTSTTEGFGMVLVEAQKYGCVPIAFDSFSALSDIVQDGENGYKISAFDEEEFTEKLSLLMTDEALRKKIASDGKKSVIRYDIKNISAKWDKLFKEISE